MEQRNEAAFQAPLTAQDVAGELMEENAAQEAQEAQELEAALREEIGMLFEDGWTAEELGALSQDGQVRADVAEGCGLIRAAARRLRRELDAARQMQARRSLPVTRSSAAGGMREGNRIEAMSDAQFDAFAREARAAAMMGKKIRM